MLKPFVLQRGFTIIEILISLVVIGVLMGLGIPSFTDWIQNQKIRSATDAILNGIQVARAEAVQRNTQVKVVLAADSGWVVSEAVSGTQLQARSGGESATNASVVTTPAGSTTVTFTPLGGVTANTDGTASIKQIDVSYGAIITSASRVLRVLVSGGGSIRMCDPDAGVAATDPRFCPATY